jgi:hypothetical protein
MDPFFSIRDGADLCLAGRDNGRKKALVETTLKDRFAP